jgi:hypothetical protein
MIHPEHPILPTAAGLKPDAGRRRRWLVLAVVGIVLLSLYAAGLAWVTHRLQIDVQRSVHPAPSVLEAAGD